MIICYYGQFEHFSYCENWIIDALDRGGHHCLRIVRTKWFDPTRLIKIARDHRATHVLFSKCPEVTAEQLQMVKDAGLTIVFWTFDWMMHPENWSWYEPLAKIADVCFQTDGYGEQEKYEALGINRVELHQGCVPGLHDFPKARNTVRARYQKYSTDVIFIGSEYTERRHELVRNLKQYSDGPSGGTSFEFARHGSPGPELWGAEFSDAVYFSKIVVGDNFVNDVPGYWSDRVYLTLGCGGFFMTAYVPGLEVEFTNHEHLVWWKTFQELYELIDYYLPREADRRAIALNGYRLAHARDTYDHRVAKMTAVLEAM